jgi:hypothetical protein
MYVDVYTYIHVETFTHIHWKSCMHIHTCTYIWKLTTERTGMPWLGTHKSVYHKCMSVCMGVNGHDVYRMYVFTCACIQVSMMCYDVYVCKYMCMRDLYDAYRMYVRVLMCMYAREQCLLWRVLYVCMCVYVYVYTCAWSVCSSFSIRKRLNDKIHIYIYIYIYIGEFRKYAYVWYIASEHFYQPMICMRHIVCTYVCLHVYMYVCMYTSENQHRRMGRWENSQFFVIQTQHTYIRYRYTYIHTYYIHTYIQPNIHTCIHYRHQANISRIAIDCWFWQQKKDESAVTVYNKSIHGRLRI